MYSDIKIRNPIIMCWVKWKRNRGHRMKWHSLVLQNLFYKTKRALVPLFHRTVNTLIIEERLAEIEPVPNIVHDFTVRVNAATLQCIFQWTKSVMTRWRCKVVISVQSLHALMDLLQVLLPLKIRITLRCSSSIENIP